MIDDMSIRIPPEVRAAMAEIARKTGALGGKTSAKNMTPEDLDAVVAYVRTIPPIKNQVERTDFQKKAFP